MSTARKLALVTLALFQACRAATEAPQPPRPESAREALAVLARREEAMQTLRALFRVTARRGDAVQTSRGALVVARPDGLRLQLFSFGVMTVFDYTAHGDRFRVRRPLEGETRLGRFSEAGVDERDLAAWDLRPLFFHGGLAGARVAESDGAWAVTLDEPPQTRILTISRHDSTVESETVLSAGKVKLHARYFDYRLVDGLALPFRIEVADPAASTSLAIEVERYTLNDPVEASVFRLPE